jgi:peptidoglycan/LPS O-acetylase OafA/YrhL
MGTFRLLLAVAVAVEHAGGLYGYRMIGGASAVQTFYVVSGFLISHILLTKYPDTPQGRWLFYSNRALRIFLPYWTVLAVSVAACLITLVLIGDGALISPWLNRFAQLDFGAKLFLLFQNLFIFGQDISLWLLVDNNSVVFAFDPLANPNAVWRFNIVAPAWTIALELSFYLIAPFIVRRRTATLAIIFVIAQIARYACYRAGIYNSALAYRFFPFEIALFVLGALGYRLYQAVSPSSQMIFAVTMAAWVSALLFAKVGFVRNNSHFYYILIAAALPCLFAFTKKRDRDRWIGELSYPLYLIHWPTQAILATLFGSDLFGRWMTAVSVGISLILSIGLLHFIVVPVDRWRTRRVAAETEHDQAQRDRSAAVAAVPRVAGEEAPLET